MSLPFWDAEEYLGTPLSATCAVPLCAHLVGGEDGRHAGGRGLCQACFQSWRRGGEPGLLRRAERLQVGKEFFQLPHDIDRVRDLIRQTALQYAEVDSEDEGAFALLDRRLMALGARFGELKKKEQIKSYHQHYRKKFIAEHGYGAWLEVDRAAKKRHRLRAAGDSDKIVSDSHPARPTGVQNGTDDSERRDEGGGREVRLGQGDHERGGDRQAAQRSLRQACDGAALGREEEPERGRSATPEAQGAGPHPQGYERRSGDGIPAPHREAPAGEAAQEPAPHALRRGGERGARRNGSEAPGAPAQGEAG